MPVHWVDDVELVRYCTVRPLVPLEDAWRLTVAVVATTMIAVTFGQIVAVLRTPEVLDEPYSVEVNGSYRRTVNSCAFEVVTA